jgi:UDP-glucose 4-epimerase
MEREDCYGEVINVGSQEELSILELAERVIDATGSDSEISLIPYTEAYEEGFEDMHRRVPDTSKVEELVGWQPTLSLDEVIADVASAQRAAAVV